MSDNPDVLVWTVTNETVQKFCCSVRLVVVKGKDAIECGSGHSAYILACESRVLQSVNDEDIIYCGDSVRFGVTYEWAIGV